MTIKAAVPALVAGYVLIQGSKVAANVECSNTDESRTNAINDVLEEVSVYSGDPISSILESINAGDYELLEIRRSLNFNGKTKIVLSDFESIDLNR